MAGLTEAFELMRTMYPAYDEPWWLFPACVGAVGVCFFIGWLCSRPGKITYTPPPLPDDWVGKPPSQKEHPVPQGEAYKWN